MKRSSLPDLYLGRKKNLQEVKEDIFTNCPYVDVYKESSRILML